MVLGGDICVTVTNFREVYNGPWRGHLCNIDTFQGGIQWSWGGICVTVTHFREIYNGPWRGHLCNSDTFQGGIQ